MKATDAWHKHLCPVCNLDWTCFEPDCKPTAKDKACYDCQMRTDERAQQDLREAEAILQDEVHNYNSEKMR